MSAQPEVVIVGGGLIGLAIAWELRQAGAAVTLLSRNFKEAAGHAAAGMLAPQAEAIPTNSSFFELCIQSRSLYPAWIANLESFTGLQTFYWPCGILAPVYNPIPRAPSPATTDPRCPAEWLASQAIAQLQPGLSDRVVGAWWYPADAQIDNRALMQTLWMACIQAGVDIREGVTVLRMDTLGDRIIGLDTSQGRQTADHYILTTGAWTQDLLPMPLQPRKGQLVALQHPNDDQDLHPNTILFAPDIYIVPRLDGRIILGATSENVGFKPDNTATGIQALLQAAIQLVPSLAHYPLREMWWGYRPTTPDELPILGSSSYTNLTLATGHHRNGILLAPITASVIKDWVLDLQAHPLLEHFNLRRFA
jgi:glycine oxidase ThiO